MNKIDHEFKPGDDVVFLGDGKIEEAVVESVRIDINKTGTGIRYQIKRENVHTDIFVSSNAVFKDRETLIKSL